MGFLQCKILCVNRLKKKLHESNKQFVLRVCDTFQNFFVYKKNCRIVECVFHGKS